MKFLAAILGLLLALIATSATAQQSLLRESVVVTSDKVTLGDLFTNAGAKADVAVAYAPQPGKRASFDAQWLYRVARHYGLDWRPLGNRERAVVVRESHVIGENEIADQIMASLIDQGVDGDMRVSLSNRNMRLYVESQADATVGVDYASYDPRTQRFTAVVSAPANDPAAARVHVSGKLFKMIEVPVLARNKGADDTIRADDIKWIKLPSDQVRRDMVIDAESLIGMAGRRGLRTDQPLRSADLKKPLLVEKNSMVTMVLQSGSMTLTTKGKALDEGSDGDTVRVSNVQSKNVVDAVVTGAGRVMVRSTGRFALMN